ncbi:m7GpppX diphosphatase-like [Daphnia pulicaria]|uniref:m7GpppX diphosphatase-like n=1 Tax=Daphnia pulicaria TaxID=35523 RepID=UPI001EEB192B|nr:m7GpppX diphosphatase-like [Daphnia pulicaria]
MTENCESEKPLKIAKLDDTNDEVVSKISPSFKTFEGFQVKRILKESPESRSIVVEGSFSGEDSAASVSSIVILEKTHFTEKEVYGILTKSTALQCLFNNDVYYNFLCHPPIQLNEVKATLIHPASEKHIEKFSTRKSFLIEETALIYQSVTLLHIRESKFDLQWVYNILEHKKEADRIVYEDLDPDCGFILLPDLKWDCRSTSNLYLTGIVCKRDIKSIRDLTSEHLPLLKNIFDKGSAAITKKYGLDKSEQRIYLHYQPSYYHLHIHFTSLQFTPPGCNVERAHLLSNVIRNIELKSSYYQEASLDFLAFEGDPLLKKYHQYIGLSRDGDY